MSYHVRDVLESACEQPPARHTTTDEIIASARRMRGRRIAAAVSGGTVATLAVVVAAAVTLSPPPSRDLPGPAGAAAPLLTQPAGFHTVLGEYRTGGYRIGPVAMVTAAYQELPVYRDGAVWRDDAGASYPLVDGLITFYRTGLFHPDQLGTGQPADHRYGEPFPVTVGGRPGVGREVTAGVAPPSGAAATGSVSPGDGIARTALAWEYAPAAWATYVPRYLEHDEPPAEAVRVAEAVIPQLEKPIRAPYRLGPLPDGWETVAVSQTPVEVSNLVSEVYLHRGSVPDAELAAKGDLGASALRVVVMKGDPKNPEIRGKDGVHCSARQPACTVVAGDYLIDVEGRFSGLSVPEVRRFVQGLQPVDLADQTAWVPVAG